MSPGFSLLLARALKIIDRSSERILKDAEQTSTADLLLRRIVARVPSGTSPVWSRDLAMMQTVFGMSVGFRAIGRSGFVGTPKIR